MPIGIQIYSFLFSFLYGIFISFSFYKIKFYLYDNKKIYNFLNSILYFTNIFIIYFIIMYEINNGVIHFYFLLTTFFSYCIFKRIFNKYNKRK